MIEIKSVERQKGKFNDKILLYGLMPEKETTPNVDTNILNKSVIIEIPTNLVVDLINQLKEN